jgi:hypothetical protein
MVAGHSSAHCGASDTDDEFFIHAGLVKFIEQIGPQSVRSVGIAGLVASPQWPKITSAFNSAVKIRFSEAELASHYVTRVRCPCRESSQIERRQMRLAQLGREISNAGV